MSSLTIHWGFMMNKNNARLQKLEQEITPQLFNSGVIIHGVGISESEHAELYELYQESEGYTHIEIQLISGTDEE